MIHTHHALAGNEVSLPRDIGCDPFRENFQFEILSVVVNFHYPPTPLLCLSSKVPERAPPPRQQQQPTISASVVKKLLQVHWDKDKGAEKPKINPDALKLTAEYLRRFVIGDTPLREKIISLLPWLSLLMLYKCSYYLIS